MIEGDGCTFWLDGAAGLDWRHCCDAHDAAYYQLVDKWEADLALMACVSQAGAPVMALVMFLGVTVFGGIWYWRGKRRARP